ncbi:MAG: hypothetical protein AB7N65_27040 [Vicinamibacterales bacterium]
MIRSFTDVTRGLWGERNSKAARRVPRTLWPVVHRTLTMLDSAQRLDDLAVSPGNRLDVLTGDRKASTACACAKTTTRSIARDPSSLGTAVHPGEILLELKAAMARRRSMKLATPR